VPTSLADIEHLECDIELMIEDCFKIICLSKLKELIKTLERTKVKPDFGKLNIFRKHYSFAVNKCYSPFISFSFISQYQSTDVNA